MLQNGIVILLILGNFFNFGLIIDNLLDTKYFRPFNMKLQDSGRWTDAATLAATHLEGSDYARSFLLPFHSWILFLFPRICY